MFDAKQLFDALLQGNSASSAGPATQRQGVTPSSGNGGASGGEAGPGGGLTDLLGQVLNQVQASARQANEATGGRLGEAADTARGAFGQAKTGVREAAGEINQATGAGQALDDIVRQLSGGKNSSELLATAKQMVKDNPTAATALGGLLGGLMIGTSTGRGLAWNATKVGGLVLLGGLAYKAYKNHQDGKPLLDAKAGSGPVGTPGAFDEPKPAPTGSGFDAASVSNDDATLYIRAMIAAAAADGRISPEERAHITAQIRDAGLSGDVMDFLEAEMRDPASVADLAARARTPENAMQVYAAARMTVDADNYAEKGFLSELVRALRLDPSLVAHIDAEVAALRI